MSESPKKYYDLGPEFSEQLAFVIEESVECISDFLLEHVMNACESKFAKEFRDLDSLLE